MVMVFDPESMMVAIVEWGDCELHPDWHDEEEITRYIDLPLKVMKSIGWLICDNEKWVILAQSYGNDRDGFTASELVKIPRAMVRDVHIIELGTGVGHIAETNTQKPKYSTYNPPPLVKEKGK